MPCLCRISVTGKVTPNMAQVVYANDRDVTKRAIIDVFILLFLSGSMTYINLGYRSIADVTAIPSRPFPHGHSLTAIPSRPFPHGHSLTAIPSRPFPHGHSLTAIPSPPFPHRHSLTAFPSPPFPHRHSLTAIPSPPFPHGHSLTAIPSPPFPHRHSLTAIPSPPFPHRHSLTCATINIYYPSFRSVMPIPSLVPQLTSIIPRFVPSRPFPHLCHN